MYLYLYSEENTFTTAFAGFEAEYAIMSESEKDDLGKLKQVTRFTILPVLSIFSTISAVRNSDKISDMCISGHSHCFISEEFG